MERSTNVRAWWAVLSAGAMLLGGAGCGAGAPDVGQVDVALAAKRLAWRNVMTKTVLPKEGCFVASHPSSTWQEIPCMPPPANPQPYLPAPPTGGGSASARGGYVGGHSSPFYVARTTN